MFECVEHGFWRYPELLGRNADGVAACGEGPSFGYSTKQRDNIVDGGWERSRLRGCGGKNDDELALLRLSRFRLLFGRWGRIAGR